MRKILIWLIGVSLVFQLSACSGPEQEPSDETLRIGILPDEGEKTLRKLYNPLFDFLAQETGRSYELVIPNSYEELVRIFGEGKIDLAYFGGATFVKAYSVHDAVPLVMRDVDSRFTSTLVVADEGFKNFQQLQGKRFAFGSKLSTSGHLMPRYFLQVERGVTPEKYFRSIEYSGQHDRTAYWVRDGKVDAGFVNSQVFRRMLTDGRLRPGDIRSIWTTPPYADYVWAVHPQVHPVDREKLQRAFLQLSVDNPQHEVILSNLSATGFYPASITDYSKLQQIMTNLGAL